MADRVITTSLVIQFTNPEGDGTLSAEIDGRPDGFNKGVTSFIFGDSPAFLVYKSPNVVIDTMDCTDGSTSSIGSATVEVQDTLTFANATEASLSKYPSGGVSIDWLGRSGSATVKGQRLVSSTPLIAMAKVTYNTVALAYKLVNASEEAVLVFIAGRVT